MTCAQGLLRLLWGGEPRSWSATGLSWTSWFHHHVSRLPAVLIFPDVSPNSILAMPRIISATLCQSSFPPSIPLLITSILNLFFTFKSFSFHHFILFTGFGAFLHFVQMIIALTTILCCFATLSLTITFVSTTSLILLHLTIMQSTCELRPPLL